MFTLIKDNVERIVYLEEKKKELIKDGFKEVVVKATVEEVNKTEAEIKIDSAKEVSQVEEIKTNQAEEVVKTETIKEEKPKRRGTR